MESLINKLKNEVILERIYISGIDGLGGAGKTTAVDSLKAQLQNEGYKIYVLHIDDFIEPKSVRYDSFREQWDCYYNIQWRYDYLVKEVLLPIKRYSKIEKKIELYDKKNDRYYLEHLYIEKGSILIIEGIFLQRKELRDYFDFIIYLNVPKNIRLNRALERDKYIGNEEDIKYRYEKRYFPAEEKYVLEYSPVKNADIVLNYA